MSKIVTKSNILPAACFLLLFATLAAINLMPGAVLDTGVFTIMAMA